MKLSDEKRIGFLLDMDGVIYKGNHLIKGAKEFIDQLKIHEIPFLFLTNNSAPTAMDYVVKLRKLGIEVSEQHFYSCAMATVDFLKLTKPNGTAYVIGEGGIITELNKAGYGVTSIAPDFVIVGEGRTLSYEMMEKAQNMVLNGAHLIATNLDTTCPVIGGERPGCGAVVSIIEKSTGVTAYSVGKPSPFMMRAARKRLNLQTANTIMIGDTMDTDIKGAFELGFNSVLVLSGNTKIENLSRYPYGPSRVVESLDHLDLKEIMAFVQNRVPYFEGAA